MRLSAVLLARAIALFDVAELNPRGRIYMPDLIPILVERFRFQEFPKQPEDFNQKKGITFSGGYFEDKSIDNLTIYNDGIKLDTKSSTESGKELLTETLNWLASDYELIYSEGLIERWAFASQITFESSVNLDALHVGLSKLGDRLTRELAGTHESKPIKVTGITLDVDRTRTNPPTLAFSIERRAKTMPHQHRYFSAAPLQTKVHLSVLEEFERNIST